MRHWVKWFLVVLLTYPASLITTVILDLVSGDFQFVDQLLYESKRRLVVTVVQDWFSAMLLVVPLFLVSLGAIHFVANIVRIPISLLAIVLILVTLLWGQVPPMLGFAAAYSIVLPLLFSRKQPV